MLHTNWSVVGSQLNVMTFSTKTKSQCPVFSVLFKEEYKLVVGYSTSLRYTSQMLFLQLCTQGYRYRPLLYHQQM